jgi:putative oxidoreductase
LWLSGVDWACYAAGDGALIIDIAVALYSTTIVTFAKNGFWGTLHEARTDVSMLLGLIFLLVVVGGGWSLEVWFAGRRDALYG